MGFSAQANWGDGTKSGCGTRRRWLLPCIQHLSPPSHGSIHSTETLSAALPREDNPSRMQGQSLFSAFSSPPPCHTCCGTCSPPCTGLRDTTVLPLPWWEPALAGLARLRDLTAEGDRVSASRMWFCPLWFSTVGPTPNPPSSRAAPKLPRTQQGSPFFSLMDLERGQPEGYWLNSVRCICKKQSQDWTKKEEC